MLRRIRIQNFKSLHDVEFAPGLNSVFVGPNASGKSNIIDALKFITAISLGGLTRALNNRGGFEDVLWKGATSNRAISFDLEFTLPSLGPAVRPPLSGIPERVFRYQFEIEGNLAGAVVVKRETFRALEPEATLMQIVAGEGEALHLDGTVAFRTSSVDTLALLETNVPNWIGTQVRTAFQQWRFYDLVPQLMKRIRQFAGAPVLQESGENLTEYLMTMKSAHAAEFRQLEQAVRDCFPSLEELVPMPTQYGQVLLTTREHGLEAPLKIWNMANGQLVFIALLALISAPPEMGSPLVCVEEPETHLHPKLIQQLVEMLLGRQFVLSHGTTGYPSQLFVTTHSPYIVDKTPLDSLWIVAKNHLGESSLGQAPSDGSLTESLQSIGLGELLFSGALSRD